MPGRVTSRRRTPGQLAPRMSGARWHGDIRERPQTEAEYLRGQRRWRSVGGFAGALLVAALFAFVIMPMRVLVPLSAVTEPAALARGARTVGMLLQTAHPWIGLGLVLMLGWLGLHLLVGMGVLLVQGHRRRRGVGTTMRIDLGKGETDLGGSIDLFDGVGELLHDRGRMWGQEDTLIFALVNTGATNRVELRVRGTGAGRSRWMDAVRNSISGIAPGSTLHVVEDDLVQATTQGQATQGYLGWCDITLMRHQNYPIKDLAMFAGGDPLGGLGHALLHLPGVRYSGMEIILRGMPRAQDWRRPLREAIGRIQARMLPDDLGAHDALVRKTEHYGYDVCLRLSVVGEQRAGVEAQLRTIFQALQSYNRPAGAARQSVGRVGQRLPPQQGWQIQALGRQGPPRMVLAHAHRAVWPGARFMPLPAPGKQRTMLGAYELAGLWHPPSLEFEDIFAWKGSKYLPPPAAAFLSEDEQREAEQGRVLPAPKTAQELNGRRLGVSRADRPDGTAGMIGPTVGDLRMGMDILGGTGSGKSSFLEVMLVEVARVGGGFGVIDAKGDLVDRIIRVLPPEVYDRVIVMDVTAEQIPSINPFDRRMLAEGMPMSVMAGLAEQIWYRMDPEIWPNAPGMQQFANMGMAAILEGEPTPTLYHLSRFYTAPRYHQEVLSRVHDPLVRDFWLVEVPNMDPKLKTSIDSFRRRLIRFVNTEIGQKMFCQPQASLYLPDMMAERKILLVKIVPELLGDRVAQFIGTVVFSSLIGAAFAQQRRIPKSDDRWDWQLWVDEIQMFLDADNPSDAERMWTRTRGMGMGLIGAHQDLEQLGRSLGKVTLNVLGGLALMSAVRSNVTEFMDAYAGQGMSEDDFSGIRMREEMLIRFPVHGRDMGLMSAQPRQRPPELGQRMHRPDTPILLPAPEGAHAANEQVAGGVARMLRDQMRELRMRGVAPDLIAMQVVQSWMGTFLERQISDIGRRAYPVSINDLARLFPLIWPAPAGNAHNAGYPVSVHDLARLFPLIWPGTAGEPPASISSPAAIAAVVRRDGPARVRAGGAEPTLGVGEVETLIHRIMPEGVGGDSAQLTIAQALAHVISPDEVPTVADAAALTGEAAQALILAYRTIRDGAEARPGVIAAGELTSLDAITALVRRHGPARLQEAGAIPTLGVGEVETLIHRIMPEGVGGDSAQLTIAQALAHVLKPAQVPTVADAAALTGEAAQALILEYRTIRDGAEARALVEHELDMLIEEVLRVIAEERRLGMAGYAQRDLEEYTVDDVVRRSGIVYGTDSLTNALHIARFARMYPAEMAGGGGKGKKGSTRHGGHTSRSGRH